MTIALRPYRHLLWIAPAVLYLLIFSIYPLIYSLDVAFTTQIGQAAASTYLTTPALAPGMYPAAARRVLSDYRSDFGTEGGPYVLYGFEAMSVVLDAIRRAGVRGNDRQIVIERFFATSNRNSVLGRYSVDVNGETTLSRYGVDRVLGGRPVFYRAISIP